MPLVAISADPPADSKKLAERRSIPFPLLSDTDLTASSAYGVASEHDEIAIPAVIIVGPKRSIEWQEVGDTIADRVSVADLLAQVDRVLAQGGE